jgi:FKBP-type peptidyl-prolyl cis-trans isomerase
MLRALNAMHYSSDESINEDEAFNSEDEAKYGKFFGDKFNSSSRYGMQVNTTKLFCVEVDVPKASDSSDVVTVDVLEGTKLVLSSACLDVPSDFGRLRLLFRCTCENEGEEMPWMCLCNYLDSNLSPTTSLNLEVVGPCIVEWKLQAILHGKFNGGSINIFGQIVPTESMSGGIVFVNKNTDLGSSIKKNSAASKVNTETKTSKANKRKLSHDMQENEATKDDSKAPSSQTLEKQNGSSNHKLSKKQRKQLAEEKAKQLEETLTAARDTATQGKQAETTSKKKKKKKQSTDAQDDHEPISKPTSLTRERRLPGGILVSDILIGTGTKVSSGRKISLHYTGSLTNGKVFDKNHSQTQPLQFRQGTGEVIRGLERGLEGMKVGGERLITVPAALGYGEKGMGTDIPPDSDLVFEVKVLKVG